jgi:hypothetical protein
MDEEVLGRELDALYGAARQDFIEERDRRVRELRGAGHRDVARGLAKARKPTVPAWAVDQLARRQPDRLDALLAAGEELRDAQRRAASGRGADALRSASRRVRELVSDLRDAAERIIAEAGGSPGSHLEDVERTLFTGAVSPTHHDALRRGVLDRPLEGAGFGGVEGLLVAPPPAESGRGDEPADDVAADEEARAAEERRREEQRRRRTERRRLERHQHDLERSGRDQERRVERAAETAGQLRARADAAEEAAGEERAELERIRDELARVQDELDALDDG